MPKNLLHTHLLRRSLAASLALGLCLLSAPNGAAVGAVVDPCAITTNPIPCENSKPGTDPSVWDVTGAGDPSIQGFATDLSVNVGGTVTFKINATASSYGITIYRLGYYQGLGARQIATVSPSASLPQRQPACLTDAPTGLVDCGNWAPSASWTVPTSTVSGVYLALLVDSVTGASSHIPFVVRNDASNSDILFRTSDSTWQAYNDYGGNNLYYGTAPSADGRAYKVSYNRPFHTRGETPGYGTSNYLFYAEFPMIRYLESNGFNLSYTSMLDLDRTPLSLRSHKAIVTAGHDEYWSGGERSAMEGARDAGVSLALFTGNDDYWKTRLESSIDASHTPNRTLVCYKETLANKAIDPQDPGTWTGTWRDPRFSPPADGGRPENALSGNIFTVNRGSATPVITAAFAKLRFWRDTAVAGLTGSQTVSLAPQTIGYEWDEDVDNGSRPAGLMDLSSTTVSVTERIRDYGNTYTPGTATHSLTLYRAPSGSLVFSAGSVQWSWGLDTTHDTQPDAGPSSPDLNMQQSVINLFADMGVQPDTLQPGLIAESKTTDTTAPTATISAPAANTSVQSGSPVTITGTAADSGGVVAGVEVSVDSGATWHPATGTASWHYSWTAGAPGMVTFKVRAVDDSGNLSSPGAAVAITVTPRACPCSLLTASGTPASSAANDTAAVELGMKFTADSSGFINGVRFYKTSSNTGVHTGSLWTSGGSLMATGTFTGESATGWQTLTFTNPVALQANALYVVSYHTNVGNYANDAGAFLTGLDAWPLHAPGGFNGVYSYGPSQYPVNASTNSTSYWVDVIFNTTFKDTVPPAVASVTPVAGATNVSFVALPTVTFTKDVVPSSIGFSVADSSGTQVPGTVTYSSTAFRATFTPRAPLPQGKTLTATLSSASNASGFGIAGPYTWSFTVSLCPCSVFTASSTPAVASAGDPNSVELGMAFQPDGNGYINAVRFFKGAANTGTHVGSLWTAAGQRLASVTFSNETASGWQVAKFVTPVAVTANAQYVISYHAPNGGYAYTGGGLAAGADNGPLHAAAGANGLYAYGPGSFPTGSYNSTNYWVDVVYNTAFIDDVAPAVMATTPAANASNVSMRSPITMIMNKAVVPASVQFTLSGPSGPVSGSVGFANGNTTISLLYGAALQVGSYTASLSGVVDASGNALTPSPYTWTFTVPACCSLFGTGSTPSVASANDTGSVELGMRFSSDLAGNVTGIRFYKGSGNVGTHVGSLWNSSGQLLAQVAFTGETAGGWQQMSFASPVPITAGASYVVSYHAPNGHYSADSNFFNSGLDAGLLHAPASGSSGNGLYSYGSGSVMPNQTYQATNYWVDVQFSPS